MTVWPSPIPGPREFCPFDVPAWAVRPLSRVIDLSESSAEAAARPAAAGAFSWPSGDEVATWAVADQWFAVAEALTGPRDEAFAAAAPIASPQFAEAWRQLAGDPSAPLNALAPVASELGAAVAECARELEAAKLEAWTEIGRFLRDLLGLSVSTPLIAPAVEVLIAVTRLALRQIFAGLALRLAGGTSAAARVADETTRRLFPPTTTADVELAAAPVAPPENEVAAPGPALGREKTAKTSSGISASGILRRSYGSSESTRRVLSSDLDVPDRHDPGTQTVAIPPIPSVRGETTVLMEISGPIVSDPPPAPTSHFGYLPDDRRDDYSAYLDSVGQDIRAKIAGLDRLAEQETLGGSAERGEEVRRHISTLRAILADLENAAADHAGAASAAAGADQAGATWAAAGADQAGATWAAAGADHAGASRAADHADTSPGEEAAHAGTKPHAAGMGTEVYGGLGAALAVHQQALENAMPRDGDGRATRLADPRAGEWFQLINAGGPAADPTRALNCTDAVLALYDTYLLGRPRVAAPRSFDGYAHGEPSRPTGGEWDGPRRIEARAGTTFQNLCPFQGAADPASARSAVDAALLNLANHLHNSGHGAFAFVLTDLERGGCHAWATINHGGAILFLDPQIGRLSEEVPLYAHRGAPADANVLSMDALVVDAEARPAPLPYHGPGQWTTRAPAP
ncbi:toxin glutamine deamidase domain-containing protein [Actinoplanes sp. CA-030573]|uniref:toxin glutamine deamidase domain-containing protein n=1 Tax=Actinoplanes sp. CA-030573 TaxID=3239898 RepID=UPI003D8E0C4B